MKVAVSSQGKELDSLVDPRFGRARYFLVVDTETREFEAHDNERNLSVPQGAGIQAAKTVADLDVEAVCSGHVGPKAFSALRAAGISVYLNASGTVEETVDRLNAGQLEEAEGADVEGRWT